MVDRCFSSLYSADKEEKQGITDGWMPAGLFSLNITIYWSERIY